MKKIFSFILGLGVMLSANAQNPFAYGLSSGTVDADAKTLEVTYSLNAAATSVNALIKDAEGTVVKTIALTGVTKGTHTATLDLTGAGTGDFTWAIQVTGGATSGTPTNYNSWYFYHPSGIDVDNSPESPSFGTIFVVEGYHGSGVTTYANTASSYISYPANNGNVTDAGGLYMFTPALESIKGTDGYARFYPSFLTLNHSDLGYGADFSKVAVADDGRIFVSRYNLQGDYILYAENMESLKNGGTFTSLLAGKTMTNAIYNDDEGNYLAGPVQAMDVKGSGADTKILSISRANNGTTLGVAQNRAVEYNIGNGTALTTANSYSALDQNSVYAYFRYLDIEYDNRGGVWFCQYASQDVPNLVYVSSNGVKTVIANNTLYRRGGISVNPDGTMLAVAGPANKNITIYNIVYNEDGSVTLNDNTSTTVSGNNTNCMSWDIAGNLYVGNTSSEFVNGYAIARATNTVATPAASKYAFTIEENEPETPLTRGEYAYNLDMSIYEDENYTFSFDVTGDAPAAYIILSDVAGEKDDIVYPIGAVTQGHNEITINTNSEVADGSYHWAVQINSNAIARAGRYFTSTRTLTANTRGGVAFVKDTESDAFGKIVVSNGYAQGIDVYSPEQELESTTAYTTVASSNRSSSYRIAEHEGIVYITDWSDDASGVYTFNPATPAEPQQWFNGTRGDGGIFTNANSEVIGGGSTGVSFAGTEENSTMYLFCEDYPTASGQNLVRYDFGGAETWSQVPNKVYDNARSLLYLNNNIELAATENGVFCTQVRGWVAEDGSTSTGDNKSVPALIYVSKDGEVLYNSGHSESTYLQGFFESSAGAVTFNKDFSMMAFATQHRGIVVYNVTWTDNVPSFTEQYVIPNSISSTSRTQKECNQLSFDVAGNLHAYFIHDGYCMFVLPNENPTATTAAKKSMLVAGGQLTDVENIATDANAPVEYYNLQGVKVENPSNGIFIKKQGSKTTKVVL